MRMSLLGLGILVAACGGNSDVSFESAGGSGGASAGASQGGSAQGGSAGSAQGGSAQGGSAQGGSAQGGSSQGGSAGAAQGGSAGQTQGGSAGLGGSAGSSAGAGGSAAGSSAGGSSAGGSAGSSAGGSAGMGTGGSGGGSVEGLLMSEYVEGSMANKAIELFNGTSSRIDLTRCELVFSFASSSNQQHIPLASPLNGLASKSTWVVCNGAATKALLDACDQPLIESPSQQYFWFNGDDSVELFCDGSLVDSLGRLGEDPGDGWGDPNNPTFTKDHTLRRKCGVTRGDTDSSNPFNPSTEWEGFGLDQFDGLGHHCGT